MKRTNAMRERVREQLMLAFAVMRARKEEPLTFVGSFEVCVWRWEECVVLCVCVCVRGVMQHTHREMSERM